MRIGAVIAAAGTPGGFRAYEELEHTDGTTMVRRMIETFRLAGVEDIVIVTGYRAKETEKRLAKLGAVFLRREDYETAQMLDFVKDGLEYLRKSCGRIFFCPADVPLFTEETLRKMEEQKAPVVIPLYEGRKGHPILFDTALADRITSYTGERGLKGAIDGSGAETVLVPVKDGGVLIRARREDRFEEIAQRDQALRIHPRIKLQLTGKEPFFGPGIMVLLKQIGILGSVREACEKSGMSYSKGWSLIRTAERELGYPIVDRSPGGRTGGTASVTPEGRRMMKCYEKLEQETTEFARERYREIFFPGMDENTMSNTEES